VQRSASRRAARLPSPRSRPQDGGVARHALDPLDSYGVIAARDVFNPAAATDRRVAEGLRLWGVGLHGTSGHAVIDDLETHRQELYRVGDAIRGASDATVALRSDERRVGKRVGKRVDLGGRQPRTRRRKAAPPRRPNRLSRPCAGPAPTPSSSTDASWRVPSTT
jgi:hypothetical protein